MYELTIGQDLSCYATIQIPEDTPLTRETLTEIVNHVLDNQEWKGEDVYMEEDWSSVCAARVVSVRDKNGNHLVEDMAIDPSPYDAGQVLQSWLRGYGPTLGGVIKSAVQARLIEEPVMESYRGVYKTPLRSSLSAGRARHGKRRIWPSWSRWLKSGLSIISRFQQRQKEIDAALDLSKGEIQAVDETEISEAA